MTINELALLLNRLDELNVDYTANLTKGMKVSSMWISSLRTTHENYHPALSAITSAFGHLDKEISSGIQSWRAEKDGTTLTMYRIAQCKVTGYRTVETKKKIEVETEEIETEEVPIYDCTEVE